MPVPSMFRRPPRQILQTVGTGILSREVRSEEQLRATINQISSQQEAPTTSQSFRNCSYQIVIAKSFVVTSQVVIPPKAYNIRIVGLPGTRLKATTQIAALFAINTFGTHIEGVTAEGIFDTFVSLEKVTSIGGVAVTINCDRTRIIGCDLFDSVALLYQADAADQPSGCVIQGNTMEGTTVSPDYCVELGDGNRNSIIGNVLSVGATGTLNMTGDYNDFSHNYCAAGTITSSGANNVIVGNIRCGTISASATDRVGLNS